MEFKLIIKKLNKTITTDEEIIFSKWYHKSNSHKDYFDSVKKNYNTDIDRIDIEKGWLAIQNNLKINKRKNNYWKYAVAASIVLLISINFIFNKKVDKPTIVDNNVNIEVGTDKATLTLGDGTDIILEKGQQYVSDNVESNGEEIIYKSANKSKSEIVFNYLTIPRGGEYHMKLSDGTEVWLNSESQLKFPVSFVDGETRQVELIYGEAYFDVSPSTEHKGAKFKVFNNAQEVEVLGTEFNIKAYKDETNIYTTLVEGKVTVSFEDRKQKLVPNQQSIMDINTNIVSIATVDVYNEISWKEGIFSFDEKSLKEIMKVLSRWYNMDVVFLNKTVEDEKFIGVLGKDQKIEDILSSIKNFGIIKDYKINEKTVVLK